MASTPQYIGTPKNGSALINTANANRDGTGTLGTVYTAGASGARIDSLVIQALGTTTAGMVRLFLSDGTNHRLVREVPVFAVTPSATQAAWAAEVTWDRGMVMQATWTLRASTHNAESFAVTPIVAGDF